MPINMHVSLSFSPMLHVALQLYLHAWDLSASCTISTHTTYTTYCASLPAIAIPYKPI